MPDLDQQPPDDYDPPDGCAVDMAEDPTPDDDIDGITLFADVDASDPEAVARRKAEWEALWGGGD
jgi:hypothetical protein